MTSTPPSTHPTAEAAIVAAVRQAYDSGETHSYEWRKGQLEALKTILVREAGALEAALLKDLGKNPTESRIIEIGSVITEADYALKHLRGWMKPQKKSLDLTLMPATGWTRREPLGVVLVIAPWNYPVQLLLAPLVGALAAGNAVVLKPSEVTPHVSAALATAIGKHLDNRYIRVVEGGVPETTALLQQRFDHIFYTGNGQVARIVMKAAAEHLTPVTLELGGKSPLWFDDVENLEKAARRIAWAKFSNAGQTCIAPDYILTPRRLVEPLARALAAAATAFYGPDPARSPDYGKIVSKKQFERLIPLLGDGKILSGGNHDQSARHIAPTVLEVPADRRLQIMKEEIFGPLLPIVPMETPAEAVRWINGGDKPLALYVFSNSGKTQETFLTQTSSGGAAINVALIQAGSHKLPFGGVGESGMGAYHGKYSVDTFSHRKPVLRKSYFLDFLRFIQPPYGKLARKIAQGMLR